MFLVSKLAGIMAQPLFWVALLLAVALIRLRGAGAASGRRWAAAALALLLLLGWEVPPTLALRTLEDRYPPLQSAPDGLAGMVVLGGSFMRGTLARPTGQVPLGDAAERMTESLALARTHPRWQVVFTGGDGHLFAGGWSESRMALAFWRQQGLPASRVRVEDQSRNTLENARLSARLPQVDPQAGWLLVTSAAHMPRAMAAFAHAGWKVTPYPVDFRADPEVRWTDYSLAEALRLWRVVLHEYLGSVSMWLQTR